MPLSTQQEGVNGGAYETKWFQFGLLIHATEVLWQIRKVLECLQARPSNQGRKCKIGRERFVGSDYKTHFYLYNYVKIEVF